MLCFAGESVISGFMEFLNKQGLAKGRPCDVIFLPTHSSVEWEGKFGFAAYVPSQEIIYLAGDLYSVCKKEKITFPEAKRIVLENLAHEYAHHWQSVTKRPFDENEAENLAELWVNAYFRSKQFPYESSDEFKNVIGGFSKCGE